MDYKQMTAPCGLDCFNCTMYFAKDNENLRKIISEKMCLPVEKAYCEGCRNLSGKIEAVNMKDTCPAYKCTKDKDIDFCYECDDFPCDRLHPYADMASDVPHNTKVFNLCLIKKMGLEEWGKKKAGDVKDNYFKGKWTL